MSSRRIPTIASLAGAALLAGSAVGHLPIARAAEASAVIRTATGTTADEIRATVEQFRGDLGGGSVAGANGAFGTARREINWDGVPDQFAAPGDLPPDFFNKNSPRGAVFSTPGVSFQVSSRASSGVPTKFANFNPAYTKELGVFSPERIFGPVGSTKTTVDFFVPGTQNKAVVKGFGSVFTDVDNPESSKIELFDSAGALIMEVPVPAKPGDGTFSFAGVSLPGPARIARVTITAGSLILNGGSDDSPASGRDKVAMDDFFYGEPEVAAAVAPAVTTAVTSATTAATAPAATTATTAAATVTTKAATATAVKKVVKKAVKKVAKKTTKSH